MVNSGGNDADADQDFESGAVDVTFTSGQEFSDCVIPLLADGVITARKHSLRQLCFY